MVKLIIVDDEDITREGLIEFIQWDKLGVEIVGDAADGVEALELAKKKNPDILLCDVRMPRMDGIALANNVKELFPDCKIIFLSGYSDVEYLKSAIRLKAVDYVEKPVDLKELEELISKTVGQCLDEKAKKREEEELKLRADKSIPYIKNKLAEMLVGIDKFDNEIFSEYLEHAKINLSLDKNFVCTVIAFNDLRKLEELLKLTEQHADKYHLEYISGNIGKEIVFIFSVADKEQLKHISSFCLEIAREANIYLKSGVTAAIGSIVNNIAKLPYSYNSAQKVLEYRFYYGHNTVIQYEDVINAAAPTLIFDKYQFEMLEDSLKKENIDRAIEIVEAIVTDLRQNNNADISQVKNRLFNIYLLIAKIYMEAIFQIENDNDALWTKVFMEGELSTIRNFLINKLTAIKERIALEKSNRVKSVIKEIEEYILLNYDKDISINSISNAVYLAPTYLCLLYKKERGETINEYITKVRIQKAKEVLKDRRVKLYEVARKVGYNDPNYFAKVFKKITGYNPSDYRDSIC